MRQVLLGESALPKSSFLLVMGLVFLPKMLLAAEYVDYSAPDAFNGGKSKYVVDWRKNQSVSGHAIESLEVCGQVGSLYCFRDASVSFSIPKGRLKAGLTWSRFAAESTIIRKEKISFVGQAVEVLVIASREKESLVNYFYFSEKLGLIAFKLEDPVDPDKYRFYVLADPKGFPYR